MFRFIKKYSLFLLYLLILLSGIGLLLEGAGYLYERHLQKNNPLIAAALAGEEPPVADEVPDFTLSHTEIQGWSEPKSPSHLKLNPDTLQLMEAFLAEPDPDGEKQMQLRLDFRSWSGQAREYYARLTRETVIVFNAENTVRHCYGTDAPYFEGNQGAITLAFLHHAGILKKVHKALASVRDKDKALEFSFPWSEQVANSPVFTAWCVPGLRSGPAWAHDYLFVARHPEKVERSERENDLFSSPFETVRFRYKANYQAEAPSNFRTNSLGYRDQERDIPKPEGTFRILCIGDDSTVKGKDNNSTYPALLEEHLRDLLPEQKIEVLNAGISGIDSSGQLLRFFDYMALDPDLILFQPGSSDLLNLYHTGWINFLPSFSHAARWFLPELLAPSSSAFFEALEHSLGINLNLFLALLKEKNIPCVLIAQPCPDPDLLSSQELTYFNWLGKEVFDFPAFSIESYARLIHVFNTLLESQAHTSGIFYFPADKTETGNLSIFQDFRDLNEAGIERKIKLMGHALRPLLETLLK
ncbi:MAG: hypothetical protein GX130_03195 [Candidatus Hydrogenedens sp.]|jgi:lysophospholipase L1-like esterase|nr:hypothetical protein [Candidatus Hydrogenedens sp.]